MNNPKEFLIAGKWRKGATTREVRFPYNNDLVAEVYQASDADLEEDQFIEMDNGSCFCFKCEEKLEGLGVISAA